MLLKVENVVRTFGGVHAVDGASFEVERESITGLIGPNGAGKSTLFAIIAGSIKPDWGRSRSTVIASTVDRRTESRAPASSVRIRRRGC